MKQPAARERPRVRISSPASQTLTQGLADSGSDIETVVARIRVVASINSLLLLAELYSPGRISYQRGPLTALVPLKLRL